MEIQRFFQFLAGERRGEVLAFESIEEEDGQIFLCFKDGSRCNEQLVLPLNDKNWSTQLMAEVENPTNIWSFNTERVGYQEELTAQNAAGEYVIVQPLVEGRMKTVPIPPRPSFSNFGRITKTHTPTPAPIIDPIVEEKKKNANDPVWIMAEKSKKFPTQIEMSLTVSLPAKSLFNVVEESFDNGGEKLVDYIINNLDNAKIKDELRQALIKAYGGENRTIKIEEYAEEILETQEGPTE